MWSVGMGAEGVRMVPLSWVGSSNSQNNIWDLGSEERDAKNSLEDRTDAQAPRPLAGDPGLEEEQALAG